MRPQRPLRLAAGLIGSGLVVLSAQSDLMAQDAPAKPSAGASKGTQDTGGDSRVGLRTRGGLLARLRQFSKNFKPKVTIDDESLRKLLMDRYATAVRKLEADLANFEVGLIPFSQLDDSFELIRISAADLGGEPADQIQILELDLDLAKAIEEHQVADEALGRSNRANVEEARYHRLDTEIRLMRAKMNAKKK